MRRTFFAIFLTLLLLGVSPLEFSPNRARAESRTWTVDDDGPADFNIIQEAINAANDGDTVYVHNGTYNERLTINRTINLSGENPKATTIVSPLPLSPDALQRAINITADNVNLSRFTIVGHGLRSMPYENPNSLILVYGYNSRISENNLTYSSEAVWLRGSYSTVTKNVICCRTSVAVESSYNNVSYNIMGDYLYGVYVHNCSSCWIIGNNITVKGYAFVLYRHTNVTMANNNVIIYDNVPGGRGIAHIINSTGAHFYHNNFVIQEPLSSPIFLEHEGYYPNSWDDGYPSGGNYWSQYSGVDCFRGPYQNETGSDGICDSQYILDPEGYYWCNVDRYPLMKPFPWGEHDIGVTSICKVYYEFEFIPIVPLNTVVGIGLSVHFNVFVMNYGNNAESFNITVYANSTVIGSQTNILLTSKTSVILNFTWETIPGPARSNYTLTAQATSVPGEADTTDNTTTADIYVTIAADVTGDGKVDLKDIFMIAKSYGRNAGEPGYNTNYDMNDDGKIDLKDYYFACVRFGNISP